MRQTNDPEDPPSGAGLPQPELAAAAVLRLLRPMARLMIDHGLQLPSMVELLKKALVDEAVASYGPTDRSNSDSRIAIQMGVHRKDVRRLREQVPDDSGLTPPLVPVANAVVARWISDPRFLRADRTPLPLARTPRQSHPGEPDFATLISEVSRDIGARAVLEELQRLGVATVLEDGMVQLKDTAFVPKEGLNDAFHFLANNVGDHLLTAAKNLSPHREGAPALEQSAFSDGLTPDQAAELQQAARRLWADVLQQFLASATVAEQRSQAQDGTKVRVRFGVYFSQVDQGEVGASAPKSTARRHKRKNSS